MKEKEQVNRMTASYLGGSLKHKRSFASQRVSWNNGWRQGLPEGCRRRMEALMKEDDAFRRQVENAERRQTERSAKIVERRAKVQEDQDKLHEDHVKRKKRRREGHGTSLDGSDVRANPGADSSGITRDEGRSENDHGATVTVKNSSTYDDMGIPLATAEEMSTSCDRMIDQQSKRQAESDLQEAARTRQRFAVLGHSGDTEFDVNEIFTAPRVIQLTSCTRIK